MNNPLLVTILLFLLLPAAGCVSTKVLRTEQVDPALATELARLPKPFYIKPTPGWADPLEPDGVKFGRVRRFLIAAGPSKYNDFLRASARVYGAYLFAAGLLREDEEGRARFGKLWPRGNPRSLFDVSARVLAREIDQAASLAPVGEVLLKDLYGDFKLFGLIREFWLAPRVLRKLNRSLDRLALVRKSGPALLERLSKTRRR